MKEIIMSETQFIIYFLAMIGVWEIIKILRNWSDFKSWNGKPRKWNCPHCQMKITDILAHEHYKTYHPYLISSKTGNWYCCECGIEVNLRTAWKHYTEKHKKIIIQK